MGRFMVGVGMDIQNSLIGSIFHYRFVLPIFFMGGSTI